MMLLNEAKVIISDSSKGISQAINAEIKARPDYWTSVDVQTQYQHHDYNTKYIATLKSYSLRNITGRGIRP